MVAREDVPVTSHFCNDRKLGRELLAGVERERLFEWGLELVDKGWLYRAPLEFANLGGNDTH